MLAVREAIGEPEPSDAQRDLGGGGGGCSCLPPGPPVSCTGPAARVGKRRAGSGGFCWGGGLDGLEGGVP